MCIFSPFVVGRDRDGNEIFVSVFVIPLSLCVGIEHCMGVMWCQYLGNKPIILLSFEGRDGSLRSSISIQLYIQVYF